MNHLSAEASAIIDGRHSDPFHYLGPHRDDGRTVIRAFIPNAIEIAAIDASDTVSPLARIDDAGLFAGELVAGDHAYRLRVRFHNNTVTVEDPYRFPPILGDLDLHLLTEGKIQRLYDRLGAHPMTIEGVNGVGFAVFAPNARRVSVVGDFNGWDGRRHAMRVRGAGYWEIFLPDAKVGDRYKFEILGVEGSLLPQKCDPLAFASERRPANASIVFDEAKLHQPRPAPLNINARDRAISIYEMHLGSWRRRGNGDWLTYRELAEALPAYVRDLGFTHVQFMPVNEHPFDGSWGYQPVGLFAPTSRFGSPDDFAELIDACHREGLGVLLDWVPGHFPDDPHGLARFDGTAVYEHDNPLQGRHPDWGTLIYNYGRTEVVNFLVSNALFWLDRYGVDGLRVDAVASMLYLDYSRAEGQWIPNKHGGRENLEAVEFLQRFNREVFGNFPHATTVAEESTAWPKVSQPIENGGLGFGYKWNMGWMHDTLSYISQDPVYRKYHHDKILFGLHYAFSENFVLPLSHDEVVHGKGSLLGKMPGDEWQKFANLRAYYAFMFGHPGKKLLFMGSEIAQAREWNHDSSLDWHLLDNDRNRGIQLLIKDLNRLYRDTPALHQMDCDPAGFEWLVTDDADRNVFVWIRKGHAGRARCIIAVNFSPNIYHDYRIKVSFTGVWNEVLNTDAEVYGGGNVGNAGRLVASDDAIPWLNLTLPPLAAVFLVPEQRT